MSIESKPPMSKKGKVMRIVMRFALPVLILSIGVALAIALVETAPKTKRQPPPRQARLVEIEPVHLGNHRTVVHALGTVQPAREVTLQSRVSGQVASVSKEFMPGGNFREGEMLVQLDSTDFELAVRHRESEVAQARMEVALEQGQQEVARREAEMLGGTAKEGDRSLMLRQPQLERVRARLKSAEASLALAKLELERTTVRAPFNATVRGRTVNIGMHVSPNTTLATLTGTDGFWIEAAVPLDQLKWIQIPRAAGKTGSSVRVFNEAAWGADVFRTGRVIRLLSDLDKDGRMARVLIDLEDPHALLPANAEKPKLLLNDFLRLEFEGVELPRVAAVKRHLVRDGNKIWLMNEKGELEIRTVEIAFSGRDQLFLRNSLRQGEQLVVTDISAPVQGMLLRTAEEKQEKTRPPAGEGKRGKKKESAGGN